VILFLGIVLDLTFKRIEFFKNGISQGTAYRNVSGKNLRFAISRDPILDELEFEPFSSNLKNWGFLGNDDVLVSENTIQNKSINNIPITVFGSISLKKNVHYFEISMKKCVDTSKIEIGFADKSYAWDRSYFTQSQYGYVNGILLNQ
jgi:hypothetical protein